MLWLIGNSGMLGSAVEKILLNEKLQYWATGREADITDYRQIERFSKNKEIVWVINCSGYTQVDKAEAEPERAFQTNRNGVHNIAQFCLKRKCKLIHISTDYVFNGNKKLYEPYSEMDEPDPINIYGKSKLAGEEEIKKLLNDYFIIRTSWLYGSNCSNFVTTMLKLFKEKDIVQVVDDQWGSPTYTVDLARAIVKIIKDNVRQYGVYHFANEGAIAWYGFAQEIYEQAKRLGLIENKKEVKIVPVKTEEYKIAVAKRPKNSILSKEKIKQTFNLGLRPWNEALEDYLNEFPFWKKN